MTELESILKSLDIPITQKRFFLGRCKEGGDEFLFVLDKVLQAEWDEGYKYGLKHNVSPG